MRDVFKHLLVAVTRWGITRQRAVVRFEAESLFFHQSLLALFRLRELRCYDDQAQVDHEEGPDLWT